MKIMPLRRPVSGRRIDPVAIVTGVCRHAGDRNYLTNLRRSLARAGVTAAVANHDNKVLYEALMEAFNYQGVSNKAAETFLVKHGNVDFSAVAKSLQSGDRLCPKLESFEAFRACRYRKHAQTCSNPTALSLCPVPKPELRKGQLNQAAYSLCLFIRDRARGDLVAHMDKVIAAADRPGHPDRLGFMRAAIVREFQPISGVSSKVINMTFASLLLAGDPRRKAWVETGASMIAIDTLVHNFLHRTGILHRHNSMHGYGPACYGPSGCEGILDGLAREIDARAFNPSFPPYFPRFIQLSVWRFCSEGQVNVCNGLRMDDRLRCARRECPLFLKCGRIALHA